ncbi:TolC family protein [Roseateles terrae]|uniref:Adhesin transport system outer membrane protein n=1 Tax=Roseateles terrae TaxID=431060 RepID=A0ABR6GLQ9_9BURK|nr:TolC family protein [Roseateles terrae]MBB3193053.1 adhesin transport system outer membrane protein [Roseateles terrae]
MAVPGLGYGSSDPVTTAVAEPATSALTAAVTSDPVSKEASDSDDHASRWGLQMDDFIASALTAAPVLDRARASLAAAELGVTAAKWQFGPTPSLSIESTTKGQFVKVLRVQQPLYTGGGLTANLRSAHIAVHSSQQEMAAARRQLKINLVSTWADWVKSSQRAASLEQLTRQHETLLAMIQRRTNAGTATNADAALAAARLSAVQTEWTQARMESDLQRQQLQRLSHHPVPPSLMHALDGRTPAAPTLAQMLNSIQLSPDMGLARAGVDQAHQELARSKASLMPTLSLRFDRQTGAVRDTRIGLVLQSGLTNGLGSFAGIDAARSRIQAAEAAVAATEEDLFNRYHLEFTRYASADASASAAMGTAASSDQVLASYQRQFAAGKRAWLDLLNMVRENHATRQSQHDAAVEARASLYRLRILMDTSSQ